MSDSFRSGNFRKEDLRIVKTNKTLVLAMLSLLRRRNFNRITVYDLCGEALVSRTTFYAHFNDKYSLLRHCLEDLETALVQVPPETRAAVITQYIQTQRSVLANLLSDANAELRAILTDFLSRLAGEVFPVAPDRAPSVHRGDLSLFCGGGLLSLLLWLVNKNFPTGSETLALYLCEMLQALYRWDAEWPGPATARTADDASPEPPERPPSAF
ncbi:MAG: TetR/AcrR family transcriptional regulator [Oscillospiraceae bacterium]|jgi:AcrR family transcriptional regulator|nr:TetR/AcrR family transcriptional regulator [Oscillospiraceae bacterium]